MLEVPQNKRKMLLKSVKNIFKPSNAFLIFPTRFSSTTNNIINRAELQLNPECTPDTFLLKVAVIGVPNAGKSTFINNLMDRKVCATSKKVHTTRGNATAIFTVNDTQIVFVDTPGLVNDRETKRYKLEKTFIRDSKSALKEADVIGVIHDTTSVVTRERLDIKIIRLLEKHKTKPSFLVLNKVDALKSKRKLLDLVRQLTNNCINGKPIPGNIKHAPSSEDEMWPNFQEIFMVSALTGSGLSEVKDYLLQSAKPGNWLFPSEVWTDQNAETIIINAVQATLLNFLQQEIPYQLKPAIEYFNVDENGVINTVVIVSCRSDRIAKLIAGDSDGRLKQITESVQQDLQDTFQSYVRIQIVLEPPKS